MWVLIDGYNVLFSLGMVPTPVREGDLHKARQSLLSMLYQALGEKSRFCTVVFDATRAPSKAPGDTVYYGIDVRFTRQRQEADDLITLLIQQCTSPKQLTVISSDHRLVEATSRKRATVIRADQFPDWLDRQRSAHSPASPQVATSPKISPEEQQRWLKTFSEIDQELADARTFPEEKWLKNLQIDEDDLEDPRKRHRMKPS
ncbi:MAG TPA: NYN domain-containing protein [Gemmatales bacterium]|nr:NYN domain-containing protein [Gemmatales bacterium]HMP18345.1 NYN domain-containing protein [Gemmatales bacterium]